MSPIKLLEDALAEGRSFADLAGKLRDKFKSGTADLQAIYDEAEGVVDGAIVKARDGLAAFKAEVSKVEEDVKGAEVEAIGDKPDEPAAAPIVQAVVAETGADQAHVEAAVQAHADAVAAGQSPDVAHVEAINAASAAGADSPTAAAIADSVATQPTSEPDEPSLALPGLPG